MKIDISLKMLKKWIHMLPKESICFFKWKKRIFAMYNQKKGKQKRRNKNNIKAEKLFKCIYKRRANKLYRN